MPRNNRRSVPRDDRRRPRAREAPGDRAGAPGGRAEDGTGYGTGGDAGRGRGRGAGRGGRRRGAARGAGPGDPLDPARPIAGGWRTETFRGGVWAVRPVSGARAVKVYRCPGCSQQIPAGVAHVVVWPFDAPVGLGDGVEDRRHWHTPCWAARERRPGR